MKNIKDYFGTKTAIKCNNKQQWEKLKELCGCNLKRDNSFNSNYCYFDLEHAIGLSIRNNYKFTSNGYQILPYSDFVSDVPELVGVEMEVRYNTGSEWYQKIVYGTNKKGMFITDSGAFSFCRPIQPKKVLTVTLSELAEMLNVDEIQLK